MNIFNNKENISIKQILDDNKKNFNENAFSTFKKESKSSVDINENNKIKLISKNKFDKKIFHFYYLFYNTINVFLLEYILLLSLTKSLSLSEHYIRLYINDVGYQKIFSDEYNINEYKPLRIYINKKFKVMINKIVLIEKKNSEIEIEWGNTFHNLSYMFANLMNVKEIVINNMLDSSPTSLAYMFYNCQNLETFELTGKLGTIISDSTQMFYNCTSLTKVIFKGSYSTNYMNISFMFYNNYNLNSASFSQNMKVNDMKETFYNCSSLDSLGFAAESIDDDNINISYSFYNCTNITKIEISGPIKTNDMRYMFYNCKKLNGINLNFLEIDTPANMSYSFYNCQMLNSFTWINELNTPSDMRNMFFNCSKIDTIKLPKLNTINNINMTRMFFNCTNLNTFSFGSNSRYYPNDIHEMFYNCRTLEYLDLKNVIDASNTIDMSYLFYNCSSLRTLEIKFNNQLTNNMRGIFQNCKSLTTLDLSEFYTNNVEIMWDMFNGCSKLSNLIINFTKFDTSKVIDMESMFEDCSSLTTLSLNFNTENVRYMNKMFRNCISLQSLNFSNINTNSIGIMHQMFYNCSSLEYLDIFSIKERGQSITEMFTGASNSFTFCVKENENIPNIFKLLKVPGTIRDCSERCYGEGNEREIVTSKKLCCPFFRYGDDCYENCPSKTHINNNNSKVCESFKCKNIGKYYNFEQSDCTDNITGFFVNDSNKNTIDKCHDDCVTCEGKWSNETTNCTECISTKPYIYLGNCYKNCTPGYDDENKTICKCFNTKCRICSEESLKSDLCHSCNNEFGYYPKENDTTNKSDWINCYKDPENYYLDNDIYKQCYESCKYCTKKGNYTHQYCTSCSNYFSFALPMEESDNLHFNCYPNFTYYYYFDNYGKFQNTTKKKCPDDFSKLIHGDRRCVKNCTETKYTKYEFREECFEICPPDKTFNNSENDYFCKITCPFEEPFEMVYKQICQDNCTIEERYFGKCRTNYIGNISNVEVQNKVWSNLREDMTESFFSFWEDKKYQSVVLNETDHIYEIFTTDKIVDFSSNNDNISIINMTSCYNTLREYYKNEIQKDYPLFVLKLDAKRSGQTTAMIEYLIYGYNGRKLEELDKTLCEGQNVSILFSVQLKNGTEFLYNKTSSYFQDLCFTFTSEDGTDMTLKVRQNEFTENDQSLCEQDCDFVKYHQDTGYAECRCEINITVGLVSDLRVDKDLLYKFTNVENIINFQVMKCYRLLLSIKSLTNNIGFFTYIPSFIMYLICILVFVLKEFNILKQNINDIVDAKIALKKLLDNAENEDIMVKKYEEPLFLKVLQKKGVEVSKNFYYLEKKKGKKADDIRNALTGAKLNKRKITTNNEIKEESDEDSDNTNNIVSKPKLDLINSGKDIVSKSKLKKTVPKEKEKKERLIDEKSDFSTNDSNLKNKKKKKGGKDKTAKIDFNMIDSIKGDFSDKEKAQIKYSLNYNNKELNDMSYEEALRLDQRTFFEYYISLLKTGHMLVKIFENRDYNSRAIKTFLIFLNFSSCYSINGLFFDDDTMNDIYTNKGEYKFTDQIPQIAYSTVISIVADSLFSFLALSEDDVISIKQEKIISSIEIKKNKVMSNLQVKFVLFFIISFISLLAFWYYISCFCAVYKNTQYFLLKDTLVSFASSFATPFAMKLIPPIFRIPALKRKTKTNEMMYFMSKILEIFF